MDSQTQTQSNQEILNNQNLNKVNNQNNFGIMDVLMYIGGFSLFLGISYFVLNFWNDLGDFLQVFLTLGVSIFLLIFGISLTKNNLPKLGMPLIFLTYFLFPTGLYILLNKFGYESTGPNVVDNPIVVCFVSSLLFTIVYKMLDSKLSLFFALTYYIQFYFLFVLKILVKYQQFSSDSLSNILFSSILFLGLSSYFLARYFKDKINFYYYSLNLFAVNFILLGMWHFNYFLKISDVVTNIWMVVYPSVVLYLIYYSRKVNDLLLKIFSIVYLFFYIIYLIYKNISSQYLVPVIFVTIGLVLISSGFYFYLRRPSNTEIK